MLSLIAVTQSAARAFVDPYEKQQRERKSSLKNQPRPKIVDELMEASKNMAHRHSLKQGETKELQLKTMFERPPEQQQRPQSLTPGPPLKQGGPLLSGDRRRHSIAVTSLTKELLAEETAAQAEEDEARAKAAEMKRLQAEKMAKLRNLTLKRGNPKDTI